MITKELKDFQFKCLVDNDDIEAWECSKTDTGFDSFVIVITRFTITVSGDMDSLIFRVGSKYGMKFLAGDDVEHYIYGKLEDAYRKETLDEDRLRTVVAQGFVSSLKLTVGSSFSRQDYEGTLPSSGNLITLPAWNKLICLVERSANVGGWAELFYEVNECSVLEEAYQILGDFNEGYFGHCFWLDDIHISKKCPRILERLHIVNSAAKKIVAIKQHNEKLLGDIKSEVVNIVQELDKYDYKGQHAGYATEG